MNSIGAWINPKQYLPLPDRLVLLKIGDYEYEFARLDSIERNTDNESITTTCFLPESDGGYTFELTEITAWAYAKFDDIDFD